MNSLGIHIWPGIGRGRRRGLVDAKLVQKVVDRLVGLCIAMGVILMTRNGGVHRGWWLAELKSVSLLGHVSLRTTWDDVDPTLSHCCLTAGASKMSAASLDIRECEQGVKHGVMHVAALALILVLGAIK